MTEATLKNLNKKLKPVWAYNRVMEKSELRKQLKFKRLEMTEAERTVKSREIVESLKSITDWSQVKNFHYFEPIAGLMEPDISGLVTYLEDTYPDMKLFTPRLIGKDWDLVAVKGGEAPAEFDAVLVPMLGFDSELNRIGYGGGYYDKFLASQSSTNKIGVCFEIGKVDKIPTESHDIQLNVIITEVDSYSR